MGRELIPEARWIYVSPYNLKTKMPHLPEKVRISDGTMREGEQSADVSLSVDQKVEIARALEEIGVVGFTAGNPYRSKADMELVKRLKQVEGIGIRVGTLALPYYDNWKEEIDASIDSGADSIGCPIPAADICLKYDMQITVDQMIDRCVEVVDYGRSRGVQIGSGPADVTRIEFPTLKYILESLRDRAGRTQTGISDTVGCITPPGMRYLVREITDKILPVRSVHCHNDFGLAVANALAAVEEGVTGVSCTVNGIGSRAGNAPLDEVASALEILYHVDTGIKLEKLRELSLLVSKLTGVPLSYNKPLVGDLAFSEKVDSHARRGIIWVPLTYPMSPEIVGNKVVIALGKYTGPYVIRWKIKQLGLEEATEKQMKAIEKLIEEKAIKKRKRLTDDEFIEIFNKVVRQ